MALSQQDLIIYLLLGEGNGQVNGTGSKTICDQGCGDFSRAPCSSNSYWLSFDKGWRTIGIEYDSQYEIPAKKNRPDDFFVLGDVTKINNKEILNKYGFSNVVGYLSIDVEDYTNIALKKFIDDGCDFKILTIETDIYNMGSQGWFRKRQLEEYMSDKKYIKIIEDCGLVDNTTMFLENFYINPDYLHEFQIKGIEKLYYYQRNPNDIVIDLAKRKYSQ